MRIVLVHAQSVYLALEVIDDLLVFADVCVHTLEVGGDGYFDLLSPVCLFECVYGFFERHTGLRHVHYHDGVCVATQRVFEHSGEFGVSLGDVTAFLGGISKCGDDVGRTLR